MRTCIFCLSVQNRNTDYKLRDIEHIKANSKYYYLSLAVKYGECKRFSVQND